MQQLPAGIRADTAAALLKSGTPPPDRRLSWIPSGTVSKVLTVSTFAHLPYTLVGQWVVTVRNLEGPDNLWKVLF